MRACAVAAAVTASWLDHRVLLMRRAQGRHLVSLHSVRDPHAAAHSTLYLLRGEERRSVQIYLSDVWKLSSFHPFISQTLRFMSALPGGVTTPKLGSTHL